MSNRNAEGQHPVLCHRGCHTKRHATGTCHLEVLTGNIQQTFVEVGGAQVEKAWAGLLKSSPNLEGSATYTYDLVDVGRQVRCLPHLPCTHACRVTTVTVCRLGGY